MTTKRIIALKTITEFHRSRGLPPPQHPLVSIVNYADVHLPADAIGASWVYDFYSIAIKRNLNAKMHYGQKEYDFDEGVMFFIAPGQVFSVSFDGAESWERSGWILLLHPDFLWNNTLADTINKYEYFGYEVNEALHLSEKEETVMKGIIENIQLEYHTNIDRFSQGIIITQIETMLAYAERFYQRQFITRQVSNYEILTRFEKTLQHYFDTDLQYSIGVPTVKHLATELNLSPNYLSTVLKTLTGNSPQQHIHHFLIEKAKIKLSSTGQSVGEIAYELGFEHPQSFNKLFKSKTSLSPLAFRARFS
jgi:AraC-like DNA-binding protein